MKDIIIDMMSLVRHIDCMVSKNDTSQHEIDRKFKSISDRINNLDKDRINNLDKDRIKEIDRILCENIIDSCGYDPRMESHIDLVKTVNKMSKENQKALKLLRGLSSTID